MWSTLSFAWQSAVEMAWEAALAGSIPIGAVILDGQGRLVAAGRNRLNESRKSETYYLAGLPLAHAEINALMALDYQSTNPRECTIYTTTEPCPMCAGALVMANLRHVCFASRDPWAGSTNLYTGETYLGSKRVLVEGPPDPRFEEILVALQVEYFLRDHLRRKKELLARGGPFMTRLAGAVPLGVSLGERVFYQGSLARMREERAPAGVVMDFLEEELGALAGNGNVTGIPA